MRATSRTVEAESLRFHLLEAGSRDAEPVILVHGFPQTCHMWRHQIPVLAETWRVFAPDTRGYGGTDKPRIRLSRDILARDIVELMDALGLERAHLVGHDWGGIIASAVALKHPDRVARLALIDTLVSVWINWGIHGYWFKCEPEAEQFFERHSRAFIRSIFAGEDAPYGGPPESPWAAVEGSEGSDALADFDPTPFWTPADVAHYENEFLDPGSWYHAIEYYRHCLPFHIERDDPSALHGKRYEPLSSARVAQMWRREDLIFSDPLWQKQFPVFAPEDRHRRFAGPTLYLFSRFLLPQAFAEPDRLPPDDYVPSGNLYADSFAHHFPDLRTRGALCGHFIPEEDPERTNEVLTAFLAAEI
ncbi:MAG: alpha/beta hydrolase [Myxococcota bacterium]|nr:alpha/beta hydrolase [Myxococcota bacterium]